jgi:hypothetical protein
MKRLHWSKHRVPKTDAPAVGRIWVYRALPNWQPRDDIASGWGAPEEPRMREMPAPVPAGPTKVELEEAELKRRIAELGAQRRRECPPLQVAGK